MIWPIGSLGPENLTKPDIQAEIKGQFIEI